MELYSLTNRTKKDMYEGKFTYIGKNTREVVRASWGKLFYEPQMLADDILRVGVYGS